MVESENKFKPYYSAGFFVVYRLVSRDPGYMMSGPESKSNLTVEFRDSYPLDDGLETRLRRGMHLKELDNLRRSRPDLDEKIRQLKTALYLSLHQVDDQDNKLILTVKFTGKERIMPGRQADLHDF